MKQCQNMSTHTHSKYCLRLLVVAPDREEGCPEPMKHKASCLLKSISCLGLGKQVLEQDNQVTGS